MKTSEELKATLEEMIVEFRPLLRDHDENGFHEPSVHRTFKCEDPTARKARIMFNNSKELIFEPMGVVWTLVNITEQGVAPCDICEIRLKMWHHGPVYEWDDEKDEETEVVAVEAYWAPTWAIDFRPTNGWEPK